VSMDDEAATETVARITRLLDERVQTQDGDSRPLYDRVLDVVVGMEGWADLAIKRLHEIHRLSNEECDLCARWLDA